MQENDTSRADRAFYGVNKMKEFHFHSKLMLMVVVVVSLSNALTTTTMRYKAMPTQTKTLRYASLITDDNMLNGNSEESVSPPEGVTVSPYHILHSNQFDMDVPLTKRKLSLHSSLRLLRKALTKIANGNDATVISQVHGDQKGQSPVMLRIEHTISHTVDPLCWLQAQTQTNDQPPSLYFATAEGTIETAAYGSSTNFLGTTMDDEYWNMVEALPPRSHLYGGQRFDVVDVANMGKEWGAFSKGFWMLPAIEVRREKMEHNDTLTTTTVAVHLFHNETENVGFAGSATQVLRLLRTVTDLTTSAKPPATLPPVLSRVSTYGGDMDGQELYETGVAAALAEFEKSNSTLEKVVLARRMDLSFSKYADVAALEILRKWKFGSKPGGHMFYINPGGKSGEFFGCTPERLFQVRNGQVVSEALAGTRPRGSTQQADEELSRQLFVSSKDQKENVITGNFIRAAFNDLKQRGWIANNYREKESLGDDDYGGNFYVRRLRHLQHLCQRYDCSFSDRAFSMDAIRFLLNNLHPTPAVGGYPKAEAMEFIRKYESTGFDRGFYSGPVGFVSKTSAEIVVAIRSGLVSQADERSKVSVFAGAGIVPGSTVQGEWAETAYKLAVVSSIFPQSPMTLQGAPNPNVAWATAFVEELVRNGVSQFYICPGSRSTPLVSAIAKAVRANVGSVHALSVHDERGAGFRAIGYGRGSGQPAAVVTSSGTAIANLYPSIIEAGMDGVPLILVTADRPYENRDTGANQAIDQVKAFSSSYIRWFRDILPPNDDVPIAVGLADAAHGINLAKELRGPVHFNIQFRENLAPDGGPIRNDNRLGSLTSYDGVRFTDTPAFQRWSLGGGKWTKVLSASDAVPSNNVVEIGRLIKESRRGIIVVGNLRKSTSRSQVDLSETVELLSDFAQTIGFPIFAGVQSGSLRFESPAVVPFAEHLLRSPLIQDNLMPDLVLQFGAPLVSSEIAKVIKKSMIEDLVHHVLIHPHHPAERADPEFTVSHKVDSEILPFIKALSSYATETSGPSMSSHLTPIVKLGRSLRHEIPAIIDSAVEAVFASKGGERIMTEPELVLSLSEMISNRNSAGLSLFLSNSMPVRDAEAFLYPLFDISELSEKEPAAVDTAVNRGASGIDGIISSAAGFADSTKRRTVLLIGDVSSNVRKGCEYCALLTFISHLSCSNKVAALHDINALHTLRTEAMPAESHAQNLHPMSIIVVNNDGGGIFSFLPVAKHGSDVSFEEFFGTPTSTFSFQQGAQAFGLPFHHARDPDSFKESYKKSLDTIYHSIIEATVATRDTNVAVHSSISARVNDFISKRINDDVPATPSPEILPINSSTNQQSSHNGTDLAVESRTLVLLHGWLGDKSEWDDVVASLLDSLPCEWSTIAIDLPGHGEAQLRHSSELQSTREALRLTDDDSEMPNFTIDQMAVSVYETLRDNGIDSVDALAGYSLGGRVALAMKRMSMARVNEQVKPGFNPISDTTKLVLLSAFPGEISFDSTQSQTRLQEKNSLRLQQDEKLAGDIICISNRLELTRESDEDSNLYWSSFLHRWYSAPLWGDLTNKSKLYRPMTMKRISTLSRRGRDLAAVLRQSSPSRCRNDDWRAAQPERTLFITGDLDRKYSDIGEEWQTLSPTLNHQKIPETGHALLVEAPMEVAKAMKIFLQSNIPSKDDANEVKNDESKQALQSQPIRVSVSSQEALLPQRSAAGECSIDPENVERIGSLDFEAFSIGLVDHQTKRPGVVGIGWGERSEPSNTESVEKRSGFIIQVLSTDGTRVGIGEVSPLPGLHPESLEAAETQLNAIATKIADDEDCSLPPFDALKILSMDGEMKHFLDAFSDNLGLDYMLLSVRSGLEMALISLASQVVRLPIHQALLEYAPKEFKTQASNSLLSLNGLITRGSASEVRIDENDRAYESWKVKVGHQSPSDDALAVSLALQLTPSTGEGTKAKLRADSNRGFNEAGAAEFARSLKTMDIDHLEYIEEPLQIPETHRGNWTLDYQVEVLENWFEQTSIPYALDESISDLAEIHGYDLVPMVEDMRRVFPHSRGCAAIVLKPSLLGLELSLQLARVARRDLGIGAVFTSSFDTGIGLSYAAFLASLSDASATSGNAMTYSHGLGTFSMLSEDCLDPSFGSYVKGNGQINVASLSRAFFGLSLIDFRSLSSDSLPVLQPPAFATPILDVLQGKEDSRPSSFVSDQFEASTTISSDGREIAVVASLPLPFSADIACTRFTDLPQQPRWSPWISSVSYLDDGETEWTLRVRGIYFRWRATSILLTDPYKGIRWESVSGLKNTGFVEFIPEGNSCLMKVSIAFVTPRILSSLFRGTSVFFEDFLRNKVLKWSLEMFRDVVKGDLALEEGNIELGDALFGAVEGKASAIEATLSTPIDK